MVRICEASIIKRWLGLPRHLHSTPLLAAGYIEPAKIRINKLKLQFIKRARSHPIIEEIVMSEATERTWTTVETVTNIHASSMEADENSLQGRPSNPNDRAEVRELAETGLEGQINMASKKISKITLHHYNETRTRDPRAQLDNTNTSYKRAIIEMLTPIRITTWSTSIQEMRKRW